MSPIIRDSDPIWLTLVSCFGTEDELLRRLSSLYPAGANAETDWRNLLNVRLTATRNELATAWVVSRDLLAREQEKQSDAPVNRRLSAVERMLRKRLSQEVSRVALKTVGRLLKLEGLDIAHWAKGLSQSAKRSLERARSHGCPEDAFCAWVDAAGGAVKAELTCVTQGGRPPDQLPHAMAPGGSDRLGKLHNLLQHLSYPGMHAIAAIGGLTRQSCVAVSVSDDRFSVIWPMKVALSYELSWNAEFETFARLVEVRRAGKARRGFVSDAAQERALVAACESALGVNAWASLTRARAVVDSDPIFWLHTSGRWLGLPLLHVEPSPSSAARLSPICVHLARRRSFHVHVQRAPDDAARVLIAFSGLQGYPVAGSSLPDCLAAVFASLSTSTTPAPVLRLVDSLRAAELMVRDFQPDVLLLLGATPSSAAPASRSSFESVEESIRRMRERCSRLACSIMVPLSAGAWPQSRGADVAEAYFEYGTPPDVLGSFLACLVRAMADAEEPGEALIRATRVAVRHASHKSALQPAQLWCAYEDFQTTATPMRYLLETPAEGSAGESRNNAGTVVDPDTYKMASLQEIWRRAAENAPFSELVSMLHAWANQVIEPQVNLNELSREILRLLGTPDRYVSRSLLEQRTHADTAELDSALDALAQSGSIIRVADKISLARRNPSE